MVEMYSSSWFRSLQTGDTYRMKMNEEQQGMRVFLTDRNRTAVMWLSNGVKKENGIS